MDAAPPSRLLLPEDGWTTLRARLAADTRSAALYSAVRARADLALRADAPPDFVREGKRMLSSARRRAADLVALSLVARLDSDPVAADAASRSAADHLLHACALPDWNTAHFLDTAELALGVALALDWLRPLLPPSAIARAEGALLDLALRPSFSAPPEHLWWVRADNNWTQVCHAGLVAAALAVEHREPALAEDVIARALASVPRAAAAYAPDGIFAEGPTYWAYGTTFQVLLVTLLRSAVRDCGGLDKSPGFLASADVITRLAGPSGQFFNYSDSRARRSFQPALFWFASVLNRPDLLAADLRELAPLTEALRAGHHEEEARLHPLALLWHAPTSSATASPRPSPHWCGRGGTDLALFRSAPDDPRALYFALKGGRPAHNHGHQDIGSFVFEADGVRWAVDPGLQDYDGLENHGLDLWNRAADSPRWRVFRLGPDAHNLLRFDDAPLSVEGVGHLLHHDTASSSPFAVFDLGACHGARVSRAWRGARLLPGPRLLLQDEWSTTAHPVVAGGDWLTHAEITLLPDGALLRQQGESLSIRIISPTSGSEAAALTVEDLSTPRQPFDAPNPGLRRLRFRVPCASAGKYRLALLICPSGTAALPAPELIPLADWR